jgi:pimeloyl-ACP methyl ester carboxylesterase
MFPGMTVLAMNYRGYGDSHGIPGERQMMEDGRLLYDWLAATRSAGESGRIVVVGRSLGSGIAVQLAAERAVTALVLITPYDSILAVASRRFPAMPVSMLLRHRFESVNYVQRIVAPTLVLRAASDNVVPHFHTDSLVAKMSGPVTDETIAHSNHGNIPYLSSAQLRIAGYLDELLSLAGRDRVLPAAPSVATGGNDASGAATAAGGPKFDIVIADLDKPAENLIV